MKLQLIVVVLTELVALASALPQGGEQQQGNDQERRQGERRQGGQRRQGGGSGNRKQQQQANVSVGADGKPVPLYLDPNLTLSKISKKDLDAFLASKEAVNELVTCFENLRKCKARSGVSLVRDVRSLGRGASCTKCDPEEQKHTRQLVGAAIAGLQQRHPIEWRRLLPEIGFLL